VRVRSVVVLGAGAGGGVCGAGGVAETVGQRNLVGQGGERGEVRLVGEGVDMGTVWSSSAVFVLEDDPQDGWIRFPGVHPPVVVPDPR